MNESTLVSFGGSVKALGDGRVGGYLVRFSTANDPDLSATKDFFTAQTGFGLEDNTSSAVYYAHCLDPQLKTRKIGRGTMKADDAGVWLEAQLSLRDEYEKHIYDLAQKGKLGWSSGTAAHLVTRKAVETPNGTAHEILTWPLGLDASLTPTPAEPRCDVVALKSLQDSLVPLDRPVEDHTKMLPAGMSYDDLRALLQDELNEDIGDADDGPMGGLYITDVYDDAVVYRDEQDLMRIPYTLTPGNDVTWGTPESVVRTTVYVPATDGDMAEDATATKEIITAAPPAGATFDAQLDAALAAVEGVIARGFDINELRVKSGRVMSASSRAKLKKIHGGMQAAHALLGEHVTYMSALMDETQGPVAKKAADAEIIRFLEFEARRLGVAV